jgi:hypothetical protein
VSICGILLSWLIVAAALASSFFSSSAQASDVAAEVDKPFTLKVGQSANVQPADIDLTFVNVTEDSRCPSDVTCVWAGRVSIVVDVWASGNSSRLVLTLSGGQSEAKSLGSYSVKLTNVQPFPVSTKKISPSDHVATLMLNSSHKMLSHGVFVKAKASVMAAVAGWNVEKGSGMAVLLVQEGGGLKRVIIKFAPTYSGGCSHGPDPAECINGRVTFTSDSGTAARGDNFHAEVDSYKTHMFLILPGAGSEYALNITKFREWSKPIVTGGNTSVVSLKEGQREGPLLVQKISTDRIVGLNFPEYPISTDKGFPITLRVGEKASNGCTITLYLAKIESGTATFVKTVDKSRPCPICWFQQALLSGRD